MQHPIRVCIPSGLAELLHFRQRTLETEPPSVLTGKSPPVLQSAKTASGSTLPSTSCSSHSPLPGDVSPRFTTWRSGRHHWIELHLLKSTCLTFYPLINVSLLLLLVERDHEEEQWRGTRGMTSPHSATQLP